MPQSTEVEAVTASSQSDQKAPLPKPFRGLLLVFLSLLGLLVLRMSVSSAREGWVPVLTMLGALCCVIAAAVEVVRAR